MSKEIVVFGSINKDFFSYVERFPNAGESVRGNKFYIGNGGKGANQAVTSAKLGASVTMIGMVGDDIFADSVIDNLNESGVKTELIQRVSNINTGCAIITVDDQGENNIIITPGANDKLREKDAQTYENQIEKASLLMCQGEIKQESNFEALRIAKKHGVMTFFNPAPANPNLNVEILRYVDIICTNETETELITEVTNLHSIENLRKAAQKLLDFGPKVAIITLGKNGVLIAEKNESGSDPIVNKIEASKVKVVDTTGAGDLFCGAFAYFLVNHPELGYVESAKRASKIASISVSKNGCQSSYPSIEEVKNAGIF